MRSKPVPKLDAVWGFHHPLMQALKQALSELNDYPFQSCINCDYFKNEICTVANQRPPAKVIVFGCNSWTDSDEIPF